MPYSIAATVTGLQDRLRAAGYTADLDPERLDPPGVWLQPRTVTDRALDGGGSLVLWLYLIAPNVDAHRALQLLDDLVEGLPELDLAADDGDPDLDLTAAVVLPTNPSAPLPAFRVAVTLDLQETT
jgi:hypothetical protein